jgi:Histidine kinase-, DNA gyrase B-, and HSP90-like ATPase
MAHEETVQLTDLQRIRLSPKRYVPTVDVDGLVYQARLIVMNAIEATTARHGNKGVITCLLCIDRPRETYQLVVIDNGLGIPSHYLQDYFTKLGTSGVSFTNNRGEKTGFGAKIAAALSHRLKVISATERSGITTLYIHDGVADDISEIFHPPSRNHGVTVIYEPDSVIMNSWSWPRRQPLIQFTEYGWGVLVRTFYQDHNDPNPRINFLVSDCGLPTDIWERPVSDIEQILNDYVKASTVSIPTPASDHKESIEQSQQSDCVIWWLDQPAYELVTVLLKGVDVLWPKYLMGEFISRGGRAGHGRLWVPQELTFPPLHWEYGNPVYDAIGQDCGGVVIRREDAHHVLAWPGFVTDRNLQVISVYLQFLTTPKT